LNNKTSTLRSVKRSYQQECDNKKQDIDYLNNHKEQLEDLVAIFKSGNKKYLEIKGVAQEHVNYLLTQRKTMLTIAILAVIEALKMNPDKYMATFVDSNKDDMLNDLDSFASMYLKDAFSNYQTNQAYNAIVVEIAEAFCERLSTRLVDETMASATIDL
jgi:hypothetical protein